MIRWCRREGVPLDAVALRGDSISALTWAATQRYRSESVESAAAIFALILTRYRIQITMVEHVAGVDNTRCDTLSRNEGRVGVDEILGEGMNWGLGEDPVIVELVRLCNPKREERSDEEFGGFWRDAVRCVESIADVDC